jgi:hypothetical protein
VAKVALLSQGSSEDLSSFNTRVNEELARIGADMKDIAMTSNIHESMIAGRVAVPRMLHSVLIMYEAEQQ